MCLQHREKDNHKPTWPRKQKKTAGVCGISPVGKKANLWRGGFIEKMSFGPGVEARSDK